MTDDEQFHPEHVFDQTNGLIASPEGDEPKSSNRVEVLRQRQESDALAYGMFGTGHQESGPGSRRSALTAPGS